MSQLLTVLIILFSATCVFFMLYGMSKQASAPLSFKQGLQLVITGITAFFCDTLGIGSFAINIALGKYFRLFEDKELPALANGAQVVPGAVEALFFLQLVDVDTLTLVSLIIATCLGGVIGASIVTRLKQQAIRLVMLIAFPVIALLLFGSEYHWFSFSAELISLRGYDLALACIGLFICGALTSAGIGLFAMVQAVLFLLGMSPLVAFPIMSAAGALQQPLTTLVFIKQHRIPLKKTLIISFSGLLGVVCALPLVSWLSSYELHCLLIAVLMYNTITIGRSFLLQAKTSPLTKAKAKQCFTQKKHSTSM